MRPALLPTALCLVLALTGCDAVTGEAPAALASEKATPQADASFIARNTLVTFDGNEAFGIAPLAGEEDVRIVKRDGELVEGVIIGRDDYSGHVVNYTVDITCATFLPDGRTVRLEGEYASSENAFTGTYAPGDRVIATFTDGARGRDGGVGPIPVASIAGFTGDDVPAGSHCGGTPVPLSDIKAAAESVLGACNTEYPRDDLDYCRLDRGNNQTRVNS